MTPEVPRLAPELDTLLRRCIECGLCLPHCATYVGTGNEVQSPRGRLTLLSQLAKQGSQEAPTAFLEAFDLCIGCRACEAACPSGVPFTLLEYGHDLAMAQLEGTTSRRMGLPGGEAVLRRLDSVAFLKMMAAVGGGVRQVLMTVLGSTWRRKLAGGPAGRLTRLLNSMPRDPGSDQALELFLDGLCRSAGRKTATQHPVSPTPDAHAPSAHAPAAPAPAAHSPVPRVAFFAGCANAGLLPATSGRLLALLRAAGTEVVEVPGQDCCGALASHTGRPGRAASLRRQNLGVFEPLITGETRIIVEAAGCGLEFKEKYGEEFAAKALDAVVMLASLDLPPLGEVPLKVVYHDPCHARHGQGIIAEPRLLLAGIPGLHLVESLEPEVCCGSGGAWGLTHQDFSQSLGRHKAAALAATGADLVVTSNPGCQGQIAEGLALAAPGLPILALTDLLWYSWRKGVLPAEPSS